MILQKITDLIETKNPGFSGLQSVMFIDEQVIISHFAENPQRKIEVEFENHKDAIKYLESFNKPLSSVGK